MAGGTRTSREKIASRINFVKHGDLPAKLAHLRRLRDELAAADSSVVEEFISPVIKLQSDSSSPARRLVTQIISEVGMKHLNLLPEVIPALICSLKDETPAVARQAILSGVDLFRSALTKIATQGSYSGEVSQMVKSSWEHLLKFRDEMFSMAFKVGRDGTRLPALKFVEGIVLLYTPDPNGSLEPPSDQCSEGKLEEFNISWLRGGHQILNVGDLSAEASQSLSLLLDQLRFPSLKSHNYLIIIVLIKSLLEVAIKRPAFYGRILPVLLGLDPSVSSSKGVHLAGVRHALRKAFESCLGCTHPGAAPWRARLVSALKDVTVVTSAVKQPAEEVIGDSERVHQQGDLLSNQMRKDEKYPLSAAGEHRNSGTKRVGDFPDSEMSVKRAKSTSENSEGSLREISGSRERSPSSHPTASGSDSDSGPVQQLVSMFGVLVAQGEKAAASLEILISSISADLLSEVVMANMRNLPSNYLKFEQIEDSHSSTNAYPGTSGSDVHLRHLSLLLEDILPQSTHLLKNEEGIYDSHQPASELMVTEEEELPNATDNDIVHDGLNYSSQQTTLPMNESDVVPSSLETAYATFTPEINDVELGDNDIPGLSFSNQDQNLPESSTDFSKGSSDLGNANLEMLTTLDHTTVQLAQSLSTGKSEELSPKAAATDATSIPSETPTSVGLSSQFVLPKISAPILNLRDDEKDHLQEIAFMRIVDAYKQVSVSGGSEARFSILAHSGMEFPPELDPWKLLREHILSDYVNHEGHELTLRVLYRLFGEAEDHDFFSSTAATSVYETFLIQVADTLRVSFPATDKSLSRLLGEVPNLPKSIFEMLECLCCPGGSDSNDKELRSGDRVTQGLSTVWSLILLRPPIRDACLKIALKSAVHHSEEVRMKAIRLVANKLYPLSSVSQKIEDFAEEMLLSVGIQDQKSLTKGTDGSHDELPKDESLSTSLSFPTRDISINDQEVQRGMSLYFALCTKRHSLIQKIFDVYDRTSEVAKQVIHRQIPLLVRTIGSSPDLLDIIADPPTGSEGLVIKVVHTLMEGTAPSSELVSSVMRLFNSKLKDLDILIPVLPFVHRDEVLRLFPQIVNAPLDKFQVALSRVLQGLNNSSPLLTPEEALIAIHGIDPDRDGIPLKKITDACNACFEQRNIFTQQVLAKVLNQLVGQIPLPLLFMRTVLQAIGAFPALVEFIMEILSRLVTKQIWKYPKLWVGFLKCALLTKPQSFRVLLKLPSAQLENALNRTPALRPPLVAHADQPHIRSSLPRSTLAVLGLVSEPQTQSQTSPPPQATETTTTATTTTNAQTQATTVVEASSSEKEAMSTADIASKESSSSAAD